MEPRKPTPQEKDELLGLTLAELYAVPLGDLKEEEKQYTELIEQAAIAVFDHYTTDSPGYSGKVMVVVWSGGPQLTQVYVWIDSQMDGITHARLTTVKVETR